MSSASLTSRRGLGVCLLALGITSMLFPSGGAAQGRNLPDFTELVDRVGPSVVNIRTLEKRQINPESGAITPDDEMQELLRRFFGLPIPDPRLQQPQRPNRPQPEERERERGIGSGFILTADGFIMTNAHVIQGADQVIVTLVDKREFKARIVGSDRRTDVAVVKIDAQDLPAVRLGDVSRVRPGQWVVAIGSPFGLDNTVTAGIVSARQRDTGEYLPFIQTDVAINPGNSGGPLINIDGEVIGINSQIYSRTGGSIGISFAIPIDEATRISDQLRASGRIVRGRIGVNIDQVSKELAESLGLSRPQGALVRATEAGSPAEKAGIEAGDIILQVDKWPIEKSSDLPRYIGSLRPGTSAKLKIWRRGAVRDINTAIAEFAPDEVATATAPARGGDRSGKKPGAARLMGLELEELSEAQRRELKIRGGVKVVDATEAAASAGLREGDVIVSIGNIEISSVAEFESAVKKLDKNRPASILYRRGGWAHYALIRPAK